MMPKCRLSAFAAIALSLALALATSGCGEGDGGSAAGGVTIEALASATSAAVAVPTGGKPAAPAPTATPEAAATEIVQDGAPSATPEAPSTTPTVIDSPTEFRPTDGRWIDVDVTAFTVRLMDGAGIVREIGPVGVGAQVDTGAYLSTQTGLFSVNGKVEALAYDAPYDTYISHWVGFDLDRDNGFHSFLKDAGGNVVDASTGRVSNGCIRTGEPEAIFAFAEIGMPVWVHG